MARYQVSLYGQPHVLIIDAESPEVAEKKALEQYKGAKIVRVEVIRVW